MISNSWLFWVKGIFKVMLAESRHTLKLCAIKVLKKDFIVENDEAESVKSENEYS